MVSGFAAQHASERTVTVNEVMLERGPGVQGGHADQRKAEQLVQLATSMARPSAVEIR
jgi:hypothetical protein